jgi:hypothetical protein
LSYPGYWYGVKALNTKDVIISGFYDFSTFEGTIRWSYDGGAIWTNDIVLTSTGWVRRVRFASRKDALIMDLVDGSTNFAHYTTDGGGTAADWTNVVSNPDGGWFGLEFSLLPNLHGPCVGDQLLRQFQRRSGLDFPCIHRLGVRWPGLLCQR